MAALEASMKHREEQDSASRQSGVNESNWHTFCTRKSAVERCWARPRRQTRTVDAGPGNGVGNMQGGKFVLSSEMPGRRTVAPAVTSADVASLVGLTCTGTQKFLTNASGVLPLGSRLVRRGASYAKLAAAAPSRRPGRASEGAAFLTPSTGVPGATKHRES